MSMTVSSSTVDVSLLAQCVQFAFSGKTAPNHFFKAAMTERLCTYSEEDEFARGEPTKELEKVYEIWGSGGLGVFHTGNIMVHRTYIEAKGCAILDSEIPKSYETAFARLRRAVTSHSSTPPILIGQLAYMGGKSPALPQKHPVVRAENADQSDTGVIQAMHWTRECIHHVAERFAFAACVLKAAGFDGVQIHCAYNNVITDFLSFHANTRTDEYGGLIENRSRFLLEIISAIKERVSDTSFMIGVKLNATDFLNGGLPEQDLQELASRLESAQVDYIELSGGTLEDLNLEQKKTHRQEHFLRFVKKIRAPLTKTKLAVTGGFRTAESMVNAVASGTTDFVGLARSLAHEPMLAADILAGRTTCTKESWLPNSLAINLDAGISQIQRMGRGVALRDFSDQEVTYEWLKNTQIV